MPGKKHKPEEIIGKLHEVEIVLGQGGTNADACRRGSAPRGGVGTPILGRAKDDQAASAGRLMGGLSLKVPIVSSVM